MASNIWRLECTFSSAFAADSSALVFCSRSLTNFSAALWLALIVSRNDGFDLDCFWIFVLIFDLISLYLATSSAIFFAVFCLFFISNSNSCIRSCIVFNCDWAYCFSSIFEANSSFCSASLSASFSRFKRSWAATTSLSILSNWDVFWLRIPETSVASSFSDSIFRSIECKPDEDLLSTDLTCCSCLSDFFLRVVACCFFCLSLITNFSRDANNWIKRNWSVKLWI